MAFSNTALAGSHDLIFVTITAGESCSACKSFEPVLQKLEDEYSGRVNFVRLDVSTREKIEEAKQIAQDNGLSNFFEENKGLVPKVGILCPGGEKAEKSFIGEIRKEVYESALNTLLEDDLKVCSL